MTSSPVNITDLRLSAYNYELPEELIATRPAHKRDHSRLLVYNAQNGEAHHCLFNELPNHLPINSTLVLNNSKVFPCRLIGQKSSGGKFEIFFLSLVVNEKNEYQVLIKSNSKKKVGDVFEIEDLKVEVRSNEGTYFLVGINFSHNELVNFLEAHAKTPIPPYIRNSESDEKDKSDYQTIYAQETGSVAAPTAGLHFTEDVFKQLDSKSINRAFVTLHVGAGTFQPVKVEDIQEHKMHSEFFSIEKKQLKEIQASENLFAVGTTSLRVLESCWDGEKVAFEGTGLKQTDIFLHPGKKVNSIKGLITNFHLPKSSLIMLVSTLIGREKTLELYRVAIENKYRFFSYGDAMLILL